MADTPEPRSVTVWRYLLCEEAEAVCARLCERSGLAVAGLAVSKSIDLDVPPPQGRIVRIGLLLG